MGKINCDICGYVAASARSYKCHLLKHEKERRETMKSQFKQNLETTLFACDQCDFSTSTRRGLTSHLQSHKKPYGCSSCRYRTSELSALIQHKNSKHKLCNLCDFRASSAESLHIHMSSHQEESKILKCGKCDYKTTQNKNLKLHKQVHQNGKIKCDQCSYTTIKVEYLQTHKLHKHSKRFECDQCHFSTGLKKQFEFHMLKHTGQQYFQCTDCDFHTKHRKVLKMHKKADHSVKKMRKSPQPKPQSHLLKNLKPSTKGELYACFYCTDHITTSTTVEGMVQHIMSQHPEMVTKPKISTQIIIPVTSIQTSIITPHYTDDDKSAEIEERIVDDYELENPLFSSIETIEEVVGNVKEEPPEDFISTDGLITSAEDADNYIKKDVIEVSVDTDDGLFMMSVEEVEKII